MGVNENCRCDSAIQETVGKQQIQDYDTYTIKKSLLHLGMWPSGHSWKHFCFLVMIWEWYLVSWGQGC